MIVENNVLRIRGEEAMLSTMTTSEKSMDMTNQLAVTVPLNSEKIIIFRTEVDTVKLKLRAYAQKPIYGWTSPL